MSNGPTTVYGVLNNCRKPTGCRWHRYRPRHFCSFIGEYNHGSHQCPCPQTNWPVPFFCYAINFVCHFPCLLTKKLGKNTSRKIPFPDTVATTFCVALSRFETATAFRTLNAFCHEPSKHRMGCLLPCLMGDVQRPMLLMSVRSTHHLHLPMACLCCRGLLTAE